MTLLQFFLAILESYAACKLELDETIGKKRCEFNVANRKRRNIERGLSDRNYPMTKWRPKGTLIAHLHEHKVSVFEYLLRQAK